MIRKTETERTIGKKYIFTAEEKKNFADRLTEIIKKIDDLEVDKKAVSDNYKRKIDGLEAEKHDIAVSYRTGHEIRDTLCDMFLDMEANERVWIEKETGDEIRRDPMQPEDRQLKLIA